MTAYVEHQFTKGYILDEERIRKINEIICERAKQFSSNLQPKYVVFRADSYYYETYDIQDVIKENNSGYQKITKLIIVMEEENNLNFNLAFETSWKTNLHISGEDRDKVLNFSTDLKNYISHEVCTIRVFPEHIGSKGIIKAYLLIMAITLVVLILWVQNFPITPSAEIEDILKTTDLIEKVNFLVSRYKQSNSMLTAGNKYFNYPFPIVMFLFLSASLFSSEIVDCIRKIFPNHLFLFGKEIEKNRKRQQNISNVFWGLIVATAISVLSAILF